MIETSPDLLEEAITAVREKTTHSGQATVPIRTPLKDYPELAVSLCPHRELSDGALCRPFQGLKAAYTAQVATLDEKIAAFG